MSVGEEQDPVDETTVEEHEMGNRVQLKKALLAAAFALVASACGSGGEADASQSETAAVSEGTPTSSRAETVPTTPAEPSEDSEADTDGPDETWFAEASAFMDERARFSAIVGELFGFDTELAGIDPEEGFVSVSPVSFTSICENLDTLNAYLELAPAAPGDNAIDPLWDEFVASQSAFWDRHQEMCDANLPPEPTNPVPTEIDAIFTANEEDFAACDAVLVELEAQDSASTFRCFFDTPPSPSDLDVESLDLPAEFLEWLDGGSAPLDIDAALACVEPTGTDPGLIPAGGCDIEWFGLDLQTTNDADWFMLLSEPGSFQVATSYPPNFEDGVLEMELRDNVTDPASLVDINTLGDDAAINAAYAGIEIPADLSEWVEALPLRSTSSETTIGGLPATYWILELDRETDLNSLLLTWDGESGWFVDLATDLHLWHIQHPEQPVFLVEFFPKDLPDDVEPATFQMINFIEFPAAG